MLNNKLVLRVILKIFSGFTFLWLLYIFTAGFFDSPNPSQSNQYVFDLSTINNNQSVIFKANSRPLLVIRIENEHKIFWANDPVYGCQLEFFKTYIKPVCIDIEYDLNGFSSDKNQQLSSPEFIVDGHKLIVY